MCNQIATTSSYVVKLISSCHFAYVIDIRTSHLITSIADVNPTMMDCQSGTAMGKPYVICVQSKNKDPVQHYSFYFQFQIYFLISTSDMIRCNKDMHLSKLDGSYFESHPKQSKWLQQMDPPLYILIANPSSLVSCL